MKGTKIAKLVVAVELAVIGLGVALYPLYSDFAYGREQAALHEEAAAAAASGDEHAQAGQPMPEDAVARLIVAKIDLDAYVMPGTSQAWLKKGPGHYEETPMPGESGNCAIAAHRTMYGHAFRHLDQLEAGDEIVCYTETSTAVYRVVRVIVVQPGDTYVVEQCEGSMLTLTTCNPVGSASQRLVVQAELVG